MISFYLLTTVDAIYLSFVFKSVNLFQIYSIGDFLEKAFKRITDARACLSHGGEAGKAMKFDHHPSCAFETFRMSLLKRSLVSKQSGQFSAVTRHLVIPYSQSNKFSNIVHFLTCPVQLNAIQFLMLPMIPKEHI